MKGIVLAGGTGSRLRPLTNITNKHLLPVGRYPMIYHPIGKLAEAGIKEIAIVTGTEHMGDLVRTLGSGSQWGLDFTYKVQDQAGGIAQALSLCERFVGDKDCCVLLGDNIFSDPLGKHLDFWWEIEEAAQVHVIEVPDPERYGVVAYDNDGTPVEIVEKPQNPPSNMAVTGIYVYPPTVFEIIKTLKPSARGELEISHVNDYFLREGELHVRELDKPELGGWWTDAGTFSSYHRANELAQGLTYGVFEG